MGGDKRDKKDKKKDKKDKKKEKKDKHHRARGAKSNLSDISGSDSSDAERQQRRRPQPPPPNSSGSAAPPEPPRFVIPKQVTGALAEQLMRQQAAAREALQRAKEAEAQLAAATADGLPSVVPAPLDTAEDDDEDDAWTAYESNVLLQQQKEQQKAALLPEAEASTTRNESVPAFLQAVSNHDEVDADDEGEAVPNAAQGTSSMAQKKESTKDKGETKEQEENDDEDDEDDDGLANLLAFAKAKGKATNSSAAMEEDEPSRRPPQPTGSPSTALVVVNGAGSFAGDEDGTEFLRGGKALGNQNAKPKELRPFDHSTYTYPPLKKDFFIPPPEVARLSPEEVQALQRELDGAKVIVGGSGGGGTVAAGTAAGGGATIPPPIKTWTGVGLNDAAMQALEVGGFTGPFAVQSMAIPILMSGRDLLAIAKTGSGKTLAYLLPLLRHVHFQPRAAVGEGPIGLILAPTHELASQIHHLARKLGRVMGLRVTPAYGGTSLSACIGEAKAGCEVMVATPGRLFDLLVAKRGSLTLRRCTMVVIDEADRMLDEGFGGHVAAFLDQVRPDRQLAMVSSTMPREVRVMAKQLLAKDFLELSVGGRPSPSTNVEQSFIFLKNSDEEAAEAAAAAAAAQQEHEDADPAQQQQTTTAKGFQPQMSHDAFQPGRDALSQDPRFPHLLRILGEEVPAKHKVLVFVGSKGLCDQLFVKLWEHGYQNTTCVLYSGMSEEDRHEALARFQQPRDVPQGALVLLATAVAERGVDVHHLDLVINYSMPDHYEAYIHRIGRTGRAGRKGRAVTFLMRGTPDEMMAPDLERALTQSGKDVPEELSELATTMKAKVKTGLVKHVSSYHRGFRGTSGYKYTSQEKRREERAAAKAAGHTFQGDEEDADEDLDYSSDENGVRRKKKDPTIFVAAAEERQRGGRGGDDGDGPQVVSSAMAVMDPMAAERARAVLTEGQAKLEAAKAAVTALTVFDADAHALDPTAMMEARYEVNDLGDRVRRRIISRRYLEEVESETDTSITVKGIFKDRRNAHPGKEPLHLIIRGKEQSTLTKVFRKFDELIEDATLRANRLGSGGGFTGKRNG